MDESRREQIWELFRLNLMATLYDCMAHIQRNAATGEERQMALNECYNYFSDVITSRPEWRAEGFKAEILEKEKDWNKEWVRQYREEWLKFFSHQNGCKNQWKQEFINEISRFIRDNPGSNLDILNKLVNNPKD